MSVYFFYDVSESVPFRYLTPTRMVGQLPPPYDTVMLPSDYLEFAIADFAEESSRGLVNAFGNVKRALHLTIDMLLHQYGLFRYFGKSNFPTKLGVLDDIGILPITIVENLNVERNLVEHEYDTPSKARVAEAIDVVKLLLLATERLLESTPHEVIVGWQQPRRHVLIQLEPMEGVLNFFTINAKGNYKRFDGVTYFSGLLRSFADARINPGIRVSKSAWKVVRLNKAERGEWKPILAELVNVRRRYAARRTHIDEDSAEVTIPITIPLPSLSDTSWARLMDEFMKRRFESERDGEQQQAEVPGEAGNVSVPPDD